jgi:hypothetical protein
MTLAIFNRYVDNATDVSKTAPWSGQLGQVLGGKARGRRGDIKVPLWKEILRHKSKGGGKHAKVAGRHAAPPRAFF